MNLSVGLTYMTTEGKVLYKKKLSHRICKACRPGHHQQEEASPVFNNDQVMQRFADDHIMIIGCNCQKEDLITTK